MRYLSKNITLKPHPTSKSSVLNKTNLIEEASNLFYKEKRTAKGWISWSIGLIFIFLSCFGFLIGDDEPIGKMIIILIFGLPGIFAIIYGFIAPIKYLQFDRINGIITLPRNFRSSVDIPFKSGFARLKHIQSSPGVISGMLAFVSSKDKYRVGGLLTEHHIEDYWAFTVWYMDKNRPLPPGDAFDEYRERDYERRKAEGFPKPLYPSKIQTPEATKEQQAQRERIGGW